MTDLYAAQHAKQIFKIALKKNEMNKWQSELRILASLTRDTTLVASMENPNTSIDDKARQLVERTGEISPGLLKLLLELINKGRLMDIEGIAYEYQKLLDSHRGIEGTETAEITTAISLDDNLILSIANRLTDIAGKPVVVNTKVDPELVAGIVIKVGDRVIDGSIRSKLSNLKRELGRAVK